MVKKRKTQSEGDILGHIPHFKNPLEITLFKYLVYRRDNPAGIAAAFVKAEKEGVWTCDEWGYNGLKIQQNISSALLDMQDRDILTSVQDECTEGKKQSSRQRRTPFKKCHYFSVNPNWITDTMVEEFREETNRNVICAFGLLRACAPSKMEVISYINHNILKEPSLMKDSGRALEMAMDSLYRFTSHMERNHIEESIGEYSGYYDGWPPIDVKRIQSAANESGKKPDELRRIIFDVIDSFSSFAM